MEEILEEIAKKRQKKIKAFGFDLGCKVPSDRQVPLCSPQFVGHEPLMITEIKRASPSAGVIGKISDPVSLARDYLDNGAKVISVLTEEDYFNGSLEDLIKIKNTFKNTTILRKDFIQYAQEISVSYRAGADMVLVIIAMFMGETKKEAELVKILDECKKYGITPLIEVHNLVECTFALNLDSHIIGINSRNLHTFEINKFKALQLRFSIPKDVKVIFESGIQSIFDAYLAGACDFDGLLCGSYLVKEGAKKLPKLIKAFNKAKISENLFYQYIFENSNKIPLVKICGITNIDDAITSAQAGADMLGLIMVEKSPRFINEKIVKEISKAMRKLYPQVMKVGVITADKTIFLRAKELLKEGVLDCLQLHSIDSCIPNEFALFDLKDADFCFYPCVNFEDLQDYPKNSISPFVLLDSKSNLGGGSGKSIPLKALRTLKKQGKELFIAGGVGLDNIDELLNLDVKMFDINSKIEQIPGKKDKSKVKEIIRKIKSFHSHKKD